MSGTTAIVITENTQAFKQAAHSAEALGEKELARWLDASGPMLKLAGISSDASDLVHTYRFTRDVAATSGAGIAVACYEHVRNKLGQFIKSEKGVEQELRELVELEIRRADALISEAGKWPTRSVARSQREPSAMTQEGAKLLLAWAQRMKSQAVSAEAKTAYGQLLARVKASDRAWASVTDTALSRAESVKQKFPSVTRATYEQNEAAKELIEGSYTSHGKGALFEAFAVNTERVKVAMNREARAGVHIAAARGPGWRAVMSTGELQLGTVRKDGRIGAWLKFADGGVLVVADKAEGVAAAGAAGAAKADGVAQCTAAFEFKAEKGISDLTAQQERALPRMVERWEKGEPVYVKVDITDESGSVNTKVYTLQPPDSKVGLAYYGVGTSNSFIKESELLAKQGALTTNMKLDVSNKDLRSLWVELFWTAFESL